MSDVMVPGKKYEFWRENEHHPACVVCRWFDTQGRRTTQIVATCNSTLRDCNADAQLMAEAFQKAEDAK